LTDEVTYATEAGFTLRAKPVRGNLPFPKPEFNYLEGGRLSGTVKGEVKDMPKGATELSIKFSYDGWVTDERHTYSSGEKFTLEGLEVKREVEVKVSFYGTF
jgi:hypothetical protein